MKRVLATTVATTALAVGAFGQGSITAVQTMFSTDGVTTQGANATDPNLATTWYSGTATVALYYAASSAVTSSQIAAINALDGAAGGGAAAFNLLTADGFTLASATSLTGTTAGSLTFTVSDGGFDPTSNPNTIGLVGVPTGGTGWIAMVVAGSGTYASYEGVLAWSQQLGNSPLSTPAGTPANTVTDPTGLNLVLTTVPEPGTIALAALGGASLLLFRRKK